MNRKFTVPKEVRELLEKQASEDIKTLRSELEEYKKKLAESENITKEMKDKIDALSTQQLPSFIKASLNLWLETQDYKILPDGLNIVDPIYGYIMIERELVPLMMHPLVQRLNFVNQLSFSYLEFPTANHTRLSHSLGVCKNAETALDAIQRHGRVYSSSGEKSIVLAPKDKKKLMLEAKAASLLHDIGHSPFGHCLDRYIGLKKEIPYYGHYDKYFSGLYIENYLQDLLKKLEINSDTVKSILGPDKTKLSGYSELVANIIDSPLDVDRMDYLLRDAHMTGLPLGFVSMGGLIESIRPFVSDDHYSLTYSMEALYHIEHFLYARDAMYVNCYESPIKTAAEGMIVSAVNNFSNAFKIPLDDLILLGDDQLLSTLIHFASPSMPCFKLALKIVKGDIFSQVYELPLKSPLAENNAELRAFVESMLIPEKKTTVYIQRPAEWRDILAKSANLEDNSWKILITVPPPDAYHPKEIGVNLLSRNNSGYGTVRLVEKSDIVEGFLKLQMKARLKLRVFVSSDLSAAKRESVRQIAKKTFEARS